MNLLSLIFNVGLLQTAQDMEADFSSPKKVTSIAFEEEPKHKSKDFELAPVSRELPDFSKSGSSTLGSSRDIFSSARKSTVIVKCPNGHGSGVLVRGGEFVLTNYHVIREVIDNDFERSNRYPVEVILCEVHEGRPRKADSVSAKIVSCDPSADLALLKLSETTELSANNAASLTDSEIRAGDRCLVVGSQGRGLAWSVRVGVISGNYIFPDDLTDSVVGDAREPQVIKRERVGCVVTDCPISPGDSGGPLFNIDGELAGITFATSTNLSSGATGYHIDTKTIRQFLIQSESKNAMSGVPADVWSFATAEHKFSTRKCYDLDNDGWVDYTCYTGWATHEDGVVPIGELAIFDPSDQRQKIQAEEMITIDGLIRPQFDATDVSPKGFWGAAPNGKKVFGSCFLMKRIDGLIITGHLEANGAISEQRIELPTETTPKTRLAKKIDRWVPMTIQDGSYWNMEILASLNTNHKGALSRQISHFND